jgi:hypothetical protein
MEVIQAKIAGQSVEIPAKQETGKVVDLMEALKASIDLAKKERKEEAHREKPAGTGKTARAPGRKTS